MTDRLEAAIAEFVEALRAEFQEEAAPPAERLLSIPEAADRLGIGRTALYAELQAGRCRSVKVGRRRVIPSSAIADFIAARSA